MKYTAVIVVNVLVFLVALMMTTFGKDQLSWATLSKFNWTTSGITILVIQLFYTIDSIKSVYLDQKAILLFFGAFDRDLEPGLVYVPWGFCTILRAPTGMIEKDIPADPRFIWHGDATEGEGKIPEGLFPPNRVTFAPNPGSAVTFKAIDGSVRTIPKEDAYHQRNTAEVEASYGWQVEDLHKLAVRLGTINTLSKAQSQMDDTAVRTFNSIFSKMTAAEAQMKLKEVEIRVVKELCRVTGDWGISVKFFGIKPFGYSHDLNTSVRQASEAFPKKAQVILDSEAQREKRTNEGVGAANAEYDLLAARAEAERLLAEVASTPGGQFAMAIQATQRGLETAHAVIVPQDNLFGAVAGVSELLKKMPGVVTTPSPTPSPSGGSVTGTPTQQNVQSPNPPRYGGRKGRGRK